MAVVDPHYLWAAGHVIMLTGSLYILIQSIFFRSAPKTYRASYTGALLSYCIVVFKSLGVPSLNRAWTQRAFADENVQYATLALYWWVSKPISMTVIPFATFSLFHTLTFVRTNILPKLVPPAPPVQPGQARPPPAMHDRVSRGVQLWVKNNYDHAMKFVAYAELAILARVVLGVFVFRSSILTPLFLAHFIRLRYHASPFTRMAVADLTSRVDAVLLPHGGSVENAWVTVKRVISTWGGGQMLPGDQPAPGGAPVTGAGGARAAPRR